MKVTLDLDDLLARGEITRGEYDKLRRLSRGGTAELAFNLLIGFGIVAVAAATLALVPSPWTATLIGAALCAGGALLLAGPERWRLLAQLAVAVGVLSFAGGVVLLGDGSPGAFLLAAAAAGGAAVLARSALLMVLAVLALAASTGARTGYLHAAYFLGIEQPALTIALFSVFSAAAWLLARRLPGAFEGLAIAAARTGVLLVNFGFWVGSLWGDRLGGDRLGEWPGGYAAPPEGGAAWGLPDWVLPDWAFALAWAAVLLAAGILAWRRDLRWMLNAAAVFAAIHLYTQWFERLGATPGSVLVAGLLALLFALAMRALNASLERRAGQPGR